jgi:hypothetical protein
LEGIVKDKADKPLEMANVIAFKKGTNILQSYSISDSKGNYKLNTRHETNSFSDMYPFLDTAHSLQLYEKSEGKSIKHFR